MKLYSLEQHGVSDRWGEMLQHSTNML